MKNRKDIAEEYKWDFSSYFESNEKWEECFKEYSNKIGLINSFNGKLKDRKSILKCFKFLEDLDLLAEPLYVYAHCLKDTDVTNQTYQQLLNKIESKITEHSMASSFIIPQLSRLPQKLLVKLSLDKEFKNYTKILKDVIREKEHTLNEECEKIMSSVSSFARDFNANFSNFENGDLKFNNIKNKSGKSLPMSQSLYNVYLRQDDETLRENAFVELHSAFGKFNNFLSSNYLANVKKDIFYAKNRKFNSALESALFYEEVSSEVYNMLIKMVEDNLILDQKYFALKQKLFKLKNFRISDIYYNKLKSNKKYSYEEGFNVVISALQSLGEDYINALKEMYETRKIDVFPNDNKYNGAYQTGAYSKSPMVLTNFNGNFDDISTLAHELGHAMHTYYSNKNQSMANANYPIFLAEIASTVNETLLNNYMLQNTSKKDEKMFYLNEFISRFHATVFRQTMFASFEDKIHKLIENNEPVSAQVLNETYLNLVKKYFGKKTKVTDCVKYEWSRIPHFYTAFYVYKYATGLISAINIVENLKDNTITVEDYKKFLSSGCTLDPLATLKLVKVDLSSPEPFQKAFNVLKNYIKELTSLTSK